MMSYSKNERRMNNDVLKSELQNGLRECSYNLESSFRDFKKKLD